jgi:hypothetical protein
MSCPGLSPSTDFAREEGLVEVLARLGYQVFVEEGLGKDDAIDRVVTDRHRSFEQLQPFLGIADSMGPCWSVDEDRAHQHQSAGIVKGLVDIEGSLTCLDDLREQVEGAQFVALGFISDEYRTVVVAFYAIWRRLDDALGKGLTSLEPRSDADERGYCCWVGRELCGLQIAERYDL